MGWVGFANPAANPTFGGTDRRIRQPRGLRFPRKISERVALRPPRSNQAAFNCPACASAAATAVCASSGLILTPSARTISIWVMPRKPKKLSR